MDLAAVVDEMGPTDGLREPVAGCQMGLDVEIDVGCEMTGVLASTPRRRLSIAAQEKEG